MLCFREPICQICVWFSITYPILLDEEKSVYCGFAELWLLLTINEKGLEKFPVSLRVLHSTMFLLWPPLVE